MTRFFLTLKDAVEFVSFAFEKMVGGEIYVKIKLYKNIKTSKNY